MAKKLAIIGVPNASYCFLMSFLEIVHELVLHILAVNTIRGVSDIHFVVYWFVIFCAVDSSRGKL